MKDKGFNDDPHLERAAFEAEEGDAKVICEEEDRYELVHENSSTGVRVYRMRVGGLAGGAVGDGTGGFAAVKVLGGERPDPRLLRWLGHEYSTSKIPALSGCSAARAAIQRADGDGRHAICLEWAEGVTLREWVRTNVTFPPQDSLRRSARLGGAIAGAIAEVHRAGVVHNNVTAENIIVDDQSSRMCTDEADGREGHGGEFFVKLIGLGSAVLLKVDDPVTSMCAKQNDLRALGAILYEMLYGERPSSLISSGQEVLHGKVPITGDSLTELFLPPSPELEGRVGLSAIPQCLLMVMSTLMSTGKGDTELFSYQSALEVKQDLDHMCAYPDRFFDVGVVDSGVSTGGILEFPSDRLYGRTAEVSTVSNAFDRVFHRSGQSEMMLICGASGTGKTALVRHMRKPLLQRGGIFLAGKFDLLRQGEALSAIAAAFTEYFETIFGKGGDDLDRCRMALQDIVGSDGISVLNDFVPSLQLVMGPSHSMVGRTVIGGKETQHRLAQMFRLLARAISNGSHRVVLFVDDLQWADVASIDLMKSLIVDSENRFLLIGAYRDDEVDSIDPLSGCLDEIKGLGVPITRIDIQSMANDAMNRFISETLRVPLSVSNPLASIIASRTNGNFFFAKQYLTSLRDVGLLRYSPQSRSWQWSLQRIESTDFADTAIGLASQSIAKLPVRTRHALEMAACLGCRCDEDILHIIGDVDVGGDKLDYTNLCEFSSHNSDLRLAESLDVAVDRRLMGKDGTRYFFLHDQICQAALSLIPETRRAELHRFIGMCIWKQPQQTKLEKYLFVAVDHLYLGSSLVLENDKIGLAQLFLRAGKKSISLSLFVPASRYLKAGIDLLGPDCWSHHYDLSLQLFELCADAEYCNGCEVGYLLKKVFEKAKCFEDKLGAYYTLANALGGRGNVLDAVETILLVLQELGESFPARGSYDLESYALDEWEETRGMLDEFTDETLVAMKDMTDERKVWAMKFLSCLTMQTYIAEQEYFPLATMRMVQLTMSYGICKEESDFGFALYGLILCSQFEDIQRGYQFGQMALRLLERSDNNASLCRVYSVVYANINHWREPLRRSLEPLLRGHQLGLRSGDVQFSMISCYDYCQHSLLSGVHLVSLEKSLRTISHTMREYKQDSVLGPTLALRQFVLNLMGKSVDPLRLTGDAMEEEKMEKHWVETRNEMCLCRLNFFRMWLAYLYGEYTWAAEMANKSRNIHVVNPSEFAVADHAFLDGMISLALARKTKQMKWQIAAKSALEKMRLWSTHAPCNFCHKVEILEAEFAFLEENWGKAARAYEAGIALAGENGFIQDQAIASERAAICHLASGDQVRASESCDKAYEFYLEWGAHGKADHSKQILVSLLKDDHS